MSKKPSAIIIFGMDENNIPRAGKFQEDDKIAAVASEAAKAGYKIGREETPEAQTVAKKVLRASTFLTGKKTLPQIKPDLYAKLIGCLTPFDPLMTEQGQEGQVDMASSSSDRPTSPDPWAVIEAGSTVLYCADPKEGWFLCDVTATSADGKKLTLQWRDFSGFKPFDVKRIEVGLVCKIR